MPVSVSRPPLSETELRERLAVAVAAKRDADDAAQRAVAAHERAELHREKCVRALADYAGLDETLAAVVVEALRCDAGRLSPDMSEEHELALADRARARAELAAADSAVATFLGERATAASRAGNATREAERCALAVLAMVAQCIAVQHNALLSDAAVLRERLAGFDRIATAGGGATPQAVISVLRDNHVNLARKIDSTAWTAARDALLADPMATVAIG
jgi:hypothetical protein